MIHVKIDNITAELVDRNWSSADEVTTRLLQLLTDDLEIHGGVPDIEEFIFAAIAPQLGIERVGQPPISRGDDQDESYSAFDDQIRFSGGAHLEPRAHLAIGLSDGTIASSSRALV